MAAIAPALFRPAPSAARQLDEEVELAYRTLEGAYHDGSIRLPSIPVSWIQSHEMRLAHKSATTIFGTPIAQIDREFIDVGHADLLQKSNVTSVADWIDRCSPR